MRAALKPQRSPRRRTGLAFWYDAVGSAYDERHLARSQRQRQPRRPAVASRPIPSRTSDEMGRTLLRFDGVNDALLVNAPPDLSAGLTLFVVYRVRTPVDFHGIFTASAATGTDHQQFFTLQ